MKSSVAEPILIERMIETIHAMDPDLPPVVPWILKDRIKDARLGEESQYLPVLKSALTGRLDEPTYRMYLELTLKLPPQAMQSVFEAARAHPATPAIGAGIDRILELLRRGETRSAVLHEALVRER